MGFGRSILETLECPVFVLSKIGIDKWFKLESWAKPIYQSNLYQFLCYLLPSQQELKNENENENEINKKKGQIELF